MSGQNKDTLFKIELFQGQTPQKRETAAKSHYQHNVNYNHSDDDDDDNNNKNNVNNTTSNSTYTTDY